MTPEQGGTGAGGQPPGGRPAPPLGRPFLGPTPRSGRAVTPAASSGRVTPPYLPRELSYTPARVAAVPVPASDSAAVRPTPPSAAPQAGPPPWLPTPPAGEEATVPGVEEPDRAPSPGHDDDAWDWGGEPHPQHLDRQPTDWASPVAAFGSFATDVETPSDWFEQPLAAASASPSPPAGERAAQVLEALANRLRTGALALEGRASLDSDEAVLASVLAALFARRAR